MKSAFELAMERLDAEGGEKSVTLTTEQKNALAEIDRKYAAKVAEREIFLKEQIKRASDREEINQLSRQLQDERLRLEEEKETAKEQVRRG